MSEVEKGDWQAQVATQGKFIRRPAGAGDPIVLLVHGFQQTGERFFKQVVSAIPENFEVLAVDGPFPVPFQGESGKWVLGYSWYFYSHRHKVYYVPMSAGVNFLCGWLQDQGLASRVQKVVGFSQGGYLAPFVAKKLSKVDQVIGIHSRFRYEELTDPQDYRLDCLHGEDDPLVEPDYSQDSHDKLLEMGWKGEYRLLPGVGHSISAEVLEGLTDMLGGGLAR